MNGKMRITADRQLYRRHIELRAGIETEPGKVQAACDLVFGPVQEGALVEPFMTLTPDAAQQLMDELWQCGLRPSEGEGSAGQAAAMQRHLDDMRTLTFHALKVGK